MKRIRNSRGMVVPGMYEMGGSFPDLSGDGKVTRKDVLIGRGVLDKKKKGGATKDACYSKVKARYSVWPSAYASGALAKCRKVGAANWGNKSKKK